MMAATTGALPSTNGSSPKDSKGWDGKLRVDRKTTITNPEALSDPEYSDEDAPPVAQIEADEGLLLFKDSSTCSLMLCYGRFVGRIRFRHYCKPNGPPLCGGRDTHPQSTGRTLTLYTAASPPFQLYSLSASRTSRYAWLAA